MNGLSKLIDLIDKRYHRYRKVLKVIDSKTTTKQVIKSVLSALLISLLILLIPVLISVNLFIYSKLTLILSIVLLIFLTGWGLLYFYFYYRMLQAYVPELEAIDLRLPMIFEGGILSFVLLLTGIIVLVVIF